MTVYDVDSNFIKLIGEDWMLITAGDINNFNTMTASWGGVGVLWNKEVCFCFIRPGRHTYQFAEQSQFFTISFFEEQYKDALRFCGSNSGRDVDKIAATKLTPMESQSGGVYFKQACLVLDCKKIYFQDIDPQNFLDKSIEDNYPQKDYHRMYVGSIENVYRITE